MAGFDTAVTGLAAASTNLDVIGNNIANASTTGFKATTTQFQDIYTSSVVGAGSSNIAGSGVTVGDLKQDFSAGTIEFTNNNLDLAIDGSGYFQVSDSTGSDYYTRDGSFELDDEGYIVTSDGLYVQGYGVANPTADASDISLTPIGNLQVSSTVSEPSATTEIDLSVNIDSAEEPPENEYDRTDSETSTYSTTMETYDSLGNAQTITYNFVEQSPLVEEYTFDTSDVDSANGGYITISGLQITVPQDTDNDGVYDTLGDFVDNGDGTYSLSDTAYNQLAEADGYTNSDDVDNGENRIASVTMDDSGQLTVDFYSKYTDTGDLVINKLTDSAATLSSVQATVSTRSSAETQDWTLASDTYTVGSGTVSFSFGGVTFSIAADDATVGTVSADDIGEAIVAKESAIIENNPDIEDITWNSTTQTIEVTYAADAGDVSDSTMQLTMADSSTIDATTLFGTAANASGYVDPTEVTDGDDSYEGVYRLYAYLNDDEALDLGKLTEAGSGGSAGETETGPILITFDTTTGALESVNGESVSSSGVAPTISITGADPADPDTVIALDLTGTTQYASDSIVNDTDQNGYPRGDLVGVSFESTGEMIASYSNGQSQILGVIAIASFDNETALGSVGSNRWVATQASGDAILNPPGTGLNGSLSSASLESSNVDLSSELVDLIQAQRDYQANSKTLETLNTVTQTILQI